MSDRRPLDPTTLEPASAAPGPLDGLRVLDVATMLAAPWAATYLADYGADVVKAELPGKGDPIRNWGSQVEGTGLTWRALSRNKRLITLALNKPEGQQLLLRLIPSFDVLIENFRPGVMEKWGLGPDVLLAANPRLVILRTTGFGQTGPYAERPGFGTLADAFSGLAYITGSEDRPPSLSGYPLADGVAGLAGAMAVLAALRWRDAGGGTGQVIDNSIVEANYRLIDYIMLDWEKLGLVRERMGNRIDDLAPRNTYQTSDGSWIALSGGTQSVVERLFRAMEREDMISDPRFVDNTARRANADELDAIIAEWMRSRPIDQVLSLMEEFEVAVAPVNDISQIASNEHFVARNLLQRVDDPELGPTSTTHIHPRMSATPGGVRTLGGPLGRDNEDFYVREMNFTAEELEQLRVAGAI